MGFGALPMQTLLPQWLPPAPCPQVVSWKQTKASSDLPPSRKAADNPEFWGELTSPKHWASCSYYYEAHKTKAARDGGLCLAARAPERWAPHGEQEAGFPPSLPQGCPPSPPVFLQLRHSTGFHLDQLAPSSHDIFFSLREKYSWDMARGTMPPTRPTNPNSHPGSAYSASVLYNFIQQISFSLK